MPDSTTLAQAAFKKLFGLAHTEDKTFPLGNESDATSLTIVGNDVYLETIPSTSGAVVGRIVECSGVAFGESNSRLHMTVNSADTGQDGIGYFITVPAGHSLIGQIDPSTGNAYAEGDRVHSIVPKKFGNTWRPLVYDSAGDEITPLDATDWFLDEKAGVAVFDSNPSPIPSGLECFVYVGTTLGTGFSLSGLQDVQSTGWTSGVHVGYDGSTFIPSTQGGGAGGSSTLDGLTDTTLGALTSGEHLSYNGSAWVNTFANPSGFQVPSGNYATVEQGHELWAQSGFINPSGFQVPSGNYVTVSHGNELWAISGLAFIQLSDVDGTPWVSGEFIAYDGTNYIPLSSGHLAAVLSPLIDTDTDTHVNVANDGSTVVTDATRIDFGTGITASDGGSGEADVTIDFTQVQASGNYATIDHGNELWAQSGFINPSGFQVPSGNYATYEAGDIDWAISGHSLEAHGDYNKLAPLASGQVISFNGTQWVNATQTSSSTTLDALTDTNLGTLTSGEHLSYNGTEWVNGFANPSGFQVPSGNYATVEQGHELWAQSGFINPSGFQVPSGNYVTVDHGNELWAASGNLAPSGDYATVSQGHQLWAQSGFINPSGFQVPSGNYVTVEHGNEIFAQSGFLNPSGFQVPSGNYATFEAGNQDWALSGHSLEAHGDYNKLAPLASGQVISFNGTEWVNATQHDTTVSLDSLTDTNLGTLTSGEHLSYNGTEWVNAFANPSGFQVPSGNYVTVDHGNELWAASGFDQFGFGLSIVSGKVQVDLFEDYSPDSGFSPGNTSFLGKYTFDFTHPSGLRALSFVSASYGTHPGGPTTVQPTLSSDMGLFTFTSGSNNDEMYVVRDAGPLTHIQLTDHSNSDVPKLFGALQVQGVDNTGTPVASGIVHDGIHFNTEQFFINKKTDVIEERGVRATINLLPNSAGASILISGELPYTETSGKVALFVLSGTPFSLGDPIYLVDTDQIEEHAVITLPYLAEFYLSSSTGLPFTDPNPSSPGAISSVVTGKKIIIKNIGTQHCVFIRPALSGNNPWADTEYMEGIQWAGVDPVVAPPGTVELRPKKDTIENVHETATFVNASGGWWLI